MNEREIIEALAATLRYGSSMPGHDAAILLGAIKTGKVPGIYIYDPDTVADYIKSEDQLRANLDELREKLANERKISADLRNKLARETE